MGACNEERKQIQKRITREASLLGADHADSPILFLGGEWHPGVVGIAASRIAESFWRPTWLFQRKDGIGKGSARSIPGFDVTEAMQACKDLFLKFGGHRAAGGFAFELEKEDAIRSRLIQYADSLKTQTPLLWESAMQYDCELPLALAKIPLANEVEKWKPYGNSFEEPRFRVSGKILGVQFYADKTTGEKKHTAIRLSQGGSPPQKLLFFNEVIEELENQENAAFLVSVKKDAFRGQENLTLIGHDYELR
jgi:single-stranded-DNA-specific exonuclease